MLSPTNFWMSLAGLAFLLTGIFTRRRELAAARGWDRFIALGCVFIAGSLAAFAPEHFRGPEFIQGMVPPWMPLRTLVPAFIGYALLAAAISLSLRTCMRLAATMLGLMFALFVIIDYLPAAFRHPQDRFGWIYALRDASFSAGSWALAGMLARETSPRLSVVMITFGRVVIGIAATYYGAQFLLYPGFSPGVPAELPTPAWVPAPRLLGYITGVILLLAGIALLLRKAPRKAAALIGALMTVLTLLLYVPMLLKALGGAPDAVNEAINYIADTLLYAGMALVLAAALGERSMKRGSD
jgi:uncharacterized membrane protein